MYRVLLLKLHQLIEAEQRDGSEADVLRDEMDRVYDQISDREQEQLERLSAEFYARGTRVAWLDEDVSAAFPTSAAVNQALRDQKASLQEQQT